MNFERLSFLREDNDLSQSEMGKILNINRVSISNWEHGKEIIPLKKLNEYSNYFGVSIDYLLNLTDKKNYSNGINIQTINKNDVGNNIKIIREKNNISQNKLSKFLNTTSSTVSAYESGKTLILTSFAYQICKEFNVSMDWLCGKIK